MSADPMIIVLLVLAATAAGFVDAVAGGGGLITMPALLLAGLSPVEAVATNKLQGTFGVAAATHAFWRAGHLDFHALRYAIALTALGAAAGASSVQLLDQRWLTGAMPIVLLIVAAYFAFAPRLDSKSVRPRLGPVAFAAGVALPIGFYDGVFGPGTGSFFVLALVTLAGLGLVRATASTKALNLTSNLVSLAVFIASGHVVFSVGLPMALGQALGAKLGAHAAMAHGARLIRPLIVAVCCAIALRLLLDPANPVRQWLAILGG